MKKITIVALVLALIATSTKPMIPGLIKSLEGKISIEMEAARDNPPDDWGAFDRKVAPFLRNLADLGAAGQQTAARYRQNIADLKTKTAAPTGGPGQDDNRDAILAKITPIDDNVNDHRRKFTDAITDFATTQPGDITYVDFKPFLELEQPLADEIQTAADADNISADHKQELDDALAQKMAYVAENQLYYAASVLAYAQWLINAVTTDLPKAGTVDDDEYKNSVAWTNNALKFIDFARKKGLAGGIKDTTNTDAALAVEDKNNLKPTADNVRVALVGLWETVWNIIIDTGKDMPMRIALGDQGIALGKDLRSFLEKWAPYFTTEEFKSPDGKDHPFDNLNQYKTMMQVAKGMAETEQLAAAALPPAIAVVAPTYAEAKPALEAIPREFGQHFGKLRTGEIELAEFSAKEFIERLQDAEAAPPAMTDAEQREWQDLIGQIKTGIGQRQLEYTNSLLGEIAKELGIGEDIKQNVKTEAHAARADTLVANKLQEVFLAIQKGLGGDMDFNEYVTLVLAQTPAAAATFHQNVQTLRKTLFDLWEAILEVVQGEKDWEMRKHLGENAGIRVASVIDTVETTLTPYLPDGMKTVQSTDGVDHPIQGYSLEDYADTITQEAARILLGEF